MLEYIRRRPRELPESILYPIGFWTSSTAYQDLRDWFSVIEFQKWSARVFPELGEAPYFDTSYRARNKAQLPPLQPVTSIQEPSLEQEYSYTQIPSKFIRLLHLDPGGRDDAISCSLVACAVDDLPSFEALSYTWGDTTTKFTISCRGFSLKIHSNALCALRDLRQENSSRILWIDAICINQDDTAERTAQVQFMRQIYSKANRVLIWMQAVVDDMTIILNMFSKLSVMLATEDIADRQTSMKAADEVFRDLPDAGDLVWKALDALLWSSWFSRIWIIQEIALAREAILVSGSATCPWEEVSRAAHYINNHSLTAIIDVDPSQVLRLESMADSCRDNASILAMAQLARASKATDPRDKIYALLGLASDGSTVVPDYSVGASECFTDFALRLIEQEKSLAVLNCVEHWGYYINGQEIFQQLPSWVPNWTLSGLTEPLPETALLEQSALIFKEMSDRSQIQVQGVEVGYIKDAGDTFLEFIPMAGNSVQNSPGTTITMGVYQQRRWRQWERMAGKLSSYPTGESVHTAYVRTIVADSVQQDPGNTSDLKSSYASWLKFWRNAGQQRGRYRELYTANASIEEMQQANSFMIAHKAAAYGRRFFVTREGYFGLGPDQTRRMDRVVALCGGKTLYVLRRHEVKGALMGWRVIGECYHYGYPRNILRVNTNHQKFTLL